MRNRKCILAAVLALGLTFQAVPVSAEETVQVAEETTQSTEETAQQAEDTAQTEEETTEITIYHTNDTHGYLQGDGESIIGLPLVAGLKKADENAILVDAGSRCGKRRRNPGDDFQWRYHKGRPCVHIPVFQHDLYEENHSEDFV